MTTTKKSKNRFQARSKAATLWSFAFFSLKKIHQTQTTKSLSVSGLDTLQEMALTISNQEEVDLLTL